MLAGMTFPTGEALWTSAGTSRYLSSFCSKLPRLSSRSRYCRGQPNYGFSLRNPQQDADHCLKEDAGGPHPERGASFLGFVQVSKEAAFCSRWVPPVPGPWRIKELAFILMRAAVRCYGPWIRPAAASSRMLFRILECSACRSKGHAEGQCLRFRCRL
ncbi:uncharacterized protein ISCGN_010652 [Ixodes scapularis]